jgi:polysaccharide export outer membrane protein
MSLNGWLTPARRMLVVLSRVVLSLGGLSPVVLALAGCAWLGWGGPGANLPPIPPAESDAYHLGPGDQIRIITLSEDRLTGEFRVNDSGAVALPLLGTIQAAGLTTAELERTIGADLVKAQLIRDPSVSVEVLAYRPIFVLGEVNKPGQYAYQPGMTVVTAVAVAGGFTYRAVEDRAAIVRSVDGKAVEGRAERQTYVQPGDVITIFERRF